MQLQLLQDLISYLVKMEMKYRGYNKWWTWQERIYTTLNYDKGDTKFNKREQNNLLLIAMWEDHVIPQLNL